MAYLLRAATRWLPQSQGDHFSEVLRAIRSIRRAAPMQHFIDLPQKVHSRDRLLRQDRSLGNELLSDRDLRSRYCALYSFAWPLRTFWMARSTLGRSSR